MKTSNDRPDRTPEALAMLEAGITAILDSETFARYLATMGRFHRYSANNVALILWQRPDATRVAGYRAWQQLGRQVRKGEKGIRILAPRVRTIADEATGEDLSSAHPSQAQSRESEESALITGYGVASVFDVSQTDGEPLPEPPAPAILAGASDRGQALYAALSDWLTAEGISVTLADCGRPNGYYAPARRAIVVHQRHVGTDQAAKTLAHEAAHYVADHRSLIPAEEAETIAEGAAFVVLSRFGLDTGGYTFPYVARWARDRAVLTRNLAAIQRAAAAIIDGLTSDERRAMSDEGDEGPAVPQQAEEAA